MPRRLKILLLIPHLGGGGAEQVTFQLAQSLDPERFEIHLGLIAADQPGSKRTPGWVEVHRLEALRVRSSVFRLLALMRRVRPDLIVSNMVHLNSLILFLRPFLPRDTRILVRQNTTASLAARGWFSRLTYQMLYPLADVVICQSTAMADDLAHNFGIAPHKLAVCANPIDIEAIEQQAGHAAPAAPLFAHGRPNLLCIGRLAAEKGVDLLLRALVSIRVQYPNVRLYLLGTGPKDEPLRNLANQLALGDNVAFLGHVERPSSFYPGADLLVLPSRYEGMPNALLEAAAAGMPIVATPCSPGLIDLLHGQPGTWISGNISATSLADSVLRALGEIDADGGHTPLRFEHHFLAPFDLKQAIRSYEQLFFKVCAMDEAHAQVLSQS